MYSAKIHTEYRRLEGMIEAGWWEGSSAASPKRHRSSHAMQPSLMHDKSPADEDEEDEDDVSEEEEEDEET
jgi:hypothetical protein